MSTTEDNKVLVGESSNGRLYVYIDEHKSNMLLHIRFWYLCKREGIYKPGVKGIAIPVSGVKPVLDAIAKVLQTVTEPEIK